MLQPALDPPSTRTRRPRSAGHIRRRSINTSPNATASADQFRNAACGSAYRAYSRIRARAQRVVDQGLAERPDGAGHPVTAGDHAVERPFDPCAILVRDDQRRQELDRMTGMAGDLAENLVLLEQGYGDELAEQPLACRFQSVPGSLQLERLGRTERVAA